MTEELGIPVEIDPMVTHLIHAEAGLEMQNRDIQIAGEVVPEITALAQASESLDVKSIDQFLDQQAALDSLKSHEDLETGLRPNEPTGKDLDKIAAMQEAMEGTELPTGVTTGPAVDIQEVGQVNAQSVGGQENSQDGHAR